jgi:hypothetical protein
MPRTRNTISTPAAAAVATAAPEPLNRAYADAAQQLRMLADVCEHLSNYDFPTPGITVMIRPGGRNVDNMEQLVQTVLRQMKLRGIDGLGDPQTNGDGSGEHYGLHWSGMKSPTGPISFDVHEYHALAANGRQHPKYTPRRTIEEIAAIVDL